ncbi:MAG TPA: glycosyltransferase family 4 protein [Solirubrobacterales bacterium]|nr:glycosyltransferase family 4 protein [Solirubrobacterales bacterium]
MLDSGRARRTYGVVRALAAQAPVDVVYGAFGAAEPDATYADLAGVRLHRVERPGVLSRGPAYLSARLKGVPDDFARGVWPNIASRTAQLAQGPGPVRVIAEGPIAAAALLPFASRHPAIYCAHNLESSFRHRLGEEGMPQRSLKRFEGLLLERYAESWMVSRADMEGATALAPEARLRLVPNVVDVAAIEPVAPRSGERSVLFLADLSYEPNQEALRLLLDEAMPSLWREAPDVRLVVAGKGSDKVEPADPRVEARGFVPELRDLYEAAGCVAVPLLEGGGSPLKFVEALAFAIPIVATPRAAAGLEVAAGEHYVEAEAAGGPFARGLLAALDPEIGNPLGRAGRELAEREYSIEALERRLA